MDRERKKEERLRPAGILPDRAQPHDLQVERAVLAAMLRDPDFCIDTAEMILKEPEAFYSETHRVLFRTIIELHHDRGKAVDLVLVANKLQQEGRLEAVGGEVFLAELVGTISTVVNIESWCRTLKDYFMLRRMIDVCSDSLIKCYDPEAEAGSLVEMIETDIYKVRAEDASSSIVEVKDSIKQEFHTLDDILNGRIEVGIPTGFTPVDQYTGGLKPGEMFVLAARPSIGKTSLALNVIANIALPTRTPHPRKVAFFSLEMTAAQISRRLLCTEAGVSESVFRNRTFNQSDMDRLTRVVTAFQGARIFIDETAGLSIAELRAKVRRLKMKENIDVVVIDYLQLMHADGRQDNRQQEVAEISGGIKALAKDLKIPVLVLAQLNREVDKTVGASAKPKLAHLRESGSIEQDADIVSFLHRNRDDAKTVGENSNQSVEALWIIEKNRNGRTGEVKLLFFPARMEFVTASPRDEDDCPPTRN